MPVAGILDILDNYAFVRTTGYLPGTSDVYVSLPMVKRHGLRKGDAVTGAIKATREGEEPQQQAVGGRNNRTKFNPLARLDTINGQTPDDARRAPGVRQADAALPAGPPAAGDRARASSRRGSSTSSRRSARASAA